MIPSPSPDPHNEDACHAAAARLQHDHRNWLVLWGCYTHSYVAFPLFPAPRGTILTASTPTEMTAKMRREERVAGRGSPRSPAPWTPARPVPRVRTRPGTGSRRCSGSPISPETHRIRPAGAA